MKKTIFLLCGLSLLLSPALFSQPIIELDLLSGGFTRPVDITHAGDDRLFIVEQAGKIQILQADGNIAAEPFLDIQSSVRDNESEEGLLGLVFHPNYASNGYLYVHYTTGTSSTRRSRISRFEVSTSSADKADPASELILLEVSQPFWNHNAGDLAFGPDGYLYIPMGDGGSAGDPGDRAQAGLNFLGKILRIDVDNGTLYSIPTDNPFLNDPNVQNEIWSIGWRNPWRFSFDRLTGDMWIADVGQNAYEELCMEPANSPGGLNYGWRCYEGNASYNLNNCGPATDYADPIFDYPQNTSNWGKSITGGFVYRGQNFPALQGHYVFADYVTNNFWTLHDSAGSWVLSTQGKLISGTSKVSTFGEDAEGELYVADLKAGEIFRIVETTTSIGPGRIDGAIHLFPHPWQEQVQLEFPNPTQASFQLQIWDISGRRVRNVKGIKTDEIIIARQGIPAGIYLLELSGDNGMIYRTKIMADQID